MFTRRSFIGAVPTLYGFARAKVLASEDGSKNTEYHVSPSGDDKNDGSPSRMLRTISAAAARAYAGDAIIVHEGIYRERVTPPRGGTSGAKRIVYQAAPGERAEISGAEVIKGWTQQKNGVWKVSIPNSFFGKFNPYSDLIHGDWFDPKGRQHHTGAVYLNGEWLVEAAKLEDVSTASGRPSRFGSARWTAIQPRSGRSSRASIQTEQLVEINVRQTVFYPRKDRHQLHHRARLHSADAATPWAPPTAEQIGVIGTALEQRLDHRKQRHPPLHLFGNFTRQIWRRVG